MILLETWRVWGFSNGHDWGHQRGSINFPADFPTSLPLTFRGLARRMVSLHVPSKWSRRHAYYKGTRGCWFGTVLIEHQPTRNWISSPKDSWKTFQVILKKSTTGHLPTSVLYPESEMTNFTRQFVVRRVVHEPCRFSRNPIHRIFGI